MHLISAPHCLSQPCLCPRAAQSWLMMASLTELTCELTSTFLVTLLDRNLKRTAKHRLFNTHRWKSDGVLYSHCRSPSSSKWSKNIHRVAHFLRGLRLARKTPVLIRMMIQSTKSWWISACRLPWPTGKANSPQKERKTKVMIRKRILLLRCCAKLFLSHDVASFILLSASHNPFYAKPKEQPLFVSTTCIWFGQQFLHATVIMTEIPSSPSQGHMQTSIPILLITLLRKAHTRY